MVCTAIFTKCHLAPVKIIKAEGKWIRPFKNKDRPLDEANQRESTSVITKNVIYTTTNTAKPAEALIEDHTDTASWNTFGYENSGCPVKNFIRGQHHIQQQTT